MKKVRIEGYLFRNDAEEMRFVSESCWEKRSIEDYSTLIAWEDEICKEGSRIYAAFSSFKGKRKKVRITVEG